MITQKFKRGTLNKTTVEKISFATIGIVLNFVHFILSRIFARIRSQYPMIKTYRVYCIRIDQMN